MNGSYGCGGQVDPTIITAVMNETTSPGICSWNRLCGGFPALCIIIVLLLGVTDTTLLCPWLLAGWKGRVRPVWPIKCIYPEFMAHNIPLNFILLPIQCQGGTQRFQRGNVMELNDDGS